MACPDCFGTDDVDDVQIGCLDAGGQGVSTAEDALRARLAKLEALFERAGTAGERDAAGAAIDRLRRRLRDSHGHEPDIEMKISLPDVWSVRLFVAICRKHGVRPYRYPRQRRTTVMVRAPQHLLDQVVWVEFRNLQAELEAYFQETVDHLITAAMHSDGDDSGLEVAQPLR